MPSRSIKLKLAHGGAGVLEILLQDDVDGPQGVAGDGGDFRQGAAGVGQAGGGGRRLKRAFVQSEPSGCPDKRFKGIQVLT